MSLASPPLAEPWHDEVLDRDGLVPGGVVQGPIDGGRLLGEPALDSVDRQREHGGSATQAARQHGRPGKKAPAGEKRRRGQDEANALTVSGCHSMPLIGMDFFRMPSSR